MATMFKGIIGGNEFLTEVLVRGLTVHGPADAYCVGHCSEQLGSRLYSRCKVRYVRNITDMVPNSAVLFFVFDEEESGTLLPKIAAKIQPWTLIISLVRGLKLATLEYFFPNNEIVRLAINPSVISGAGLGAYAVSKNASTDARSMAQIVLKECGDVIAVDNEDELEKIDNYLSANTYFAYIIIRNMIKNAKQIGMDGKEASFAVSKILQGASHTLIDEGYDTADLVSRGFNDKSVAGVAGHLIKDFGMTEDIIKSVEKFEPQPKEKSPDDPENYKIHYRWSR